jgi:acetyl-CoA acetyltransferase
MRAPSPGLYDGEILPVERVELTRDETIRDNTSVEKLAVLKTVLR